MKISDALKVFIRMTVGILLAYLSALIFSYGLKTPNSSAADFYFFIAITPLMASLFCFLGELFE